MEMRHVQFVRRTIANPIVLVAAIIVGSIGRIALDEGALPALERIASMWLSASGILLLLLAVGAQQLTVGAFALFRSKAGRDRE
jgi:hypothetical protein